MGVWICAAVALMVGVAWGNETARVWPAAAGAGGHGQSTVVLRTDGTCVSVSKKMNVDHWTNIVRLAGGQHHVVGLRGDGTCVAVGAAEWKAGRLPQASAEPAFGTSDLSEWKDIVAIDCGQAYTVGLKGDGTVVVAGKFPYAKQVAEWKDIIAIMSGHFHIVGLRRDGTCMAAGANYSGECDVGGWSNIVAVGGGCDNTVGLMADGTVRATAFVDPAKYENRRSQQGQSAVGNWDGVIDVAHGRLTSVLRADGTVLFTGFDHWGVSQCMTWKDVVAISSGRQLGVIAFQSDGTVLYSGGLTAMVKDRSHFNDWTANVGPISEVNAPRVPTGRSIREPWPPKEWKPAPSRAVKAEPGSNPRFIDNKDGTVTDKDTGLVWLKNANVNVDPVDAPSMKLPWRNGGTAYYINWDAAVKFCQELGEGKEGLTDGSKPGDWRIPTRLELESLLVGFPPPKDRPASDLTVHAVTRYNEPANTPPLPAGEAMIPAGHPFVNTRPMAYWTSTGVEGRDKEVFEVRMGAGVAFLEVKTSALLWPVRGGKQAEQRKESNKEGDAK